MQKRLTATNRAVLPTLVKALPTALFQSEPFEEKVSSEFRRRSNYPSEVELTPNGAQWAKEQKRSSRRTNLPFDWPWRSGSSSKNMLKTQCIFPFYLPKDFGDLQGALFKSKNYIKI